MRTILKIWANVEDSMCNETLQKKKVAIGFKLIIMSTTQLFSN